MHAFSVQLEEIYPWSADDAGPWWSLGLRDVNRGTVPPLLWHVKAGERQAVLIDAVGKEKMWIV